MLHVCLDDSPTFSWIEMQEVSSTNDFLRHYQARTPLTLVTAEYQTHGRGQIGNTWESQKGENLLCSFLFTPPAKITPVESFTINKAVALAVRDACQEFLTEEVTVKWPNDIYVGDRKLSGMLIETVMTGNSITCVVAGIGINVNQCDWHFSKEADTHKHPTPVSLRMLCGKDILTRKVLEQLVGHLQGRLATYDVSDYESHLYHRVGFHPYCDRSGIFMARIAGIEPSGKIILETENGEQRIYAFKEVRNLVKSEMRIDEEMS